MATLSDVTDIPLSGLNHIDALLSSGPTWNFLQPTRTTLRFTFSVAGNNESGVSGQVAFGASQQSATRTALANVTAIAGIAFEETTDTVAADLHFCLVNLSGASTAGLCSWQSSYSFLGDSITAYGAEAYIYLDNVEFAAMNGNLAAGRFGYETLLHEIGHALGLKHPFDGSPTLPGGLDNTNYTLMSYTDNGVAKTTFSPFDVAALRWIYGTDGLAGALGFGAANSGRYWTGTSDGDTITAGSGNDVLEGLAGNDTLTGGSGNDILQVSGPRAAYQLTQTSATAYRLIGNDGTDTLSGIESIRFDDGTFALSALLPATPPVLAIGADAVARAEGNSGSTSFTFTVSRSGSTSATASVNWAVSAGGTSASDFVGGVLPSGTLSFAVGETSRSITIAVAGDTAFESDESFSVLLSNVSGASLGTASATSTIINDDAQDFTAPTLTASSPTDEALGVAVGANLVFTFSEPIQRGLGSIELKTASGVLVASYFANSAPELSVSLNQLTVNPAANLQPGTSYRLDIPAGAIRDLAGNPHEGLSNYNFTTLPLSGDITPPGVSIAASANGVQYGGKTKLSFTFTEAIQGFTSDDVSISATAGGKTGTTGTLGPLTATANPLVYTALYTAPAASTVNSNSIVIAAGAYADTSGNPGTGTSRALSLVSAATPIAIDFSPADDATSVTTNTGITIAFSENIQRGTGNLTLRRADGSVVENFDAATSQRLAIANNALTLDPTANLDPASTYRLDIAATAVRDQAGNAYAGTTSYNFATRAANTRTGTAADDAFLAGTGSDRIDALDGIDRVEYAGPRASFQVGRTGARLTVDQPVGDGDTDLLDHVERLHFSDIALAFDTDGHAGQVARLLGAVFGVSAVGNNEYAGIGLALLDQGMAYDELAALALEVAGAQTPSQIVNLLWANVVGSPPSEQDARPYIDLLNEGTTAGALAIFAADTELNAERIDLAGLAITGLAYLLME